MSELLEQVLHLLHEIGICIVLRLLLLRRRSHLPSTRLAPCLQINISEYCRQLFFKLVHLLWSKTRAVLRSCWLFRLLDSPSSRTLISLYSQMRRHKPVLVLDFGSQIIPKVNLVTSLFRFRNTGAPSITFPVLTWKISSTQN